MTITKNVSNYNDVLLDIQTQSGTCHPTSSFNKNNIQLWYMCYFANKSGFGVFPVALFLCLFGSSTGVLDVY
jgi:hypothetical protein